MKALYGEQNPSSASDVIEGRLIEVGLRALELGLNVVIDFGLWSRDERSALRQAAADRSAGVEMHYFEVSAVEQRARVDRRLAAEPHTTWHISDQELARWSDTMQVPTSGEIDGSEAIDAPLAGFASWDEWRRDRWPPSTAWRCTSVGTGVTPTRGSGFLPACSNVLTPTGRRDAADWRLWLIRRPGHTIEVAPPRPHPTRTSDPGGG